MAEPPTRTRFQNRVSLSIQFRMLLDVRTDFIQTLAGGLEALLELGLSLDLGLAEGHLYPAVRVDLAFAGCLDGKEDHVLEFVDHGRLHSVGLRRRHASERFQRQHHVAEFVDGVIHVLAYFEVPLAAARKLVIERMRQFCQFGLWREVMGNTAKVLDRAMVEVVPHAFPGANPPQLLA